MLKRQTVGSVVCPNCGRLVGVRDAKCFNCGRPYPGMFGYGPAIRELTGNMSFVDIVFFGCCMLFLGSLLYDVEGIRNEGIMSLFAPSTTAAYVFGDSGGLPIFQFGRWWTVLSAAFLHGGILHIALNLYYLRSLIPATEEQFGVGRTIIIYMFSSVAGFALTSGVFLLYVNGLWPPIKGLTGSPFTLGASASLCGLLGALWINGRMTGRSWMSRQLGQAMIFLLVIGFLIDGIDNLAHLGGFFGGALTAKLLKPLHSENIYHLVGALVCILLFLLSITASILHGIQTEEAFVAFMQRHLPNWL